MTDEISADPWAKLDEVLGVEVEDHTDAELGAVAFYGRCSTEDNQDPETSHDWQLGNAQKFVEPLGGSIVAEYFDVGQSRSVPWERRREANRLLTALKDPNRGWAAVVVGEGTRCWFGNQFSLVAPKLAAHGVDLWVPELGGKFDPTNPSHKMLMSVLGGMSESERQHVQARVRAAMDSQVLNEGRHQGGRAPYGYVTTDGGAHPNPRKASVGYRLRVLTTDEQTAEVVRRIFAEYLDGRGDRAIAHGLNRDRIPCPSAQHPRQNRHRHADGWQASTVRAIMQNPRYTGYAFFGRWTRQETLLDPDDVAAGNITRFRRSRPDRIVRSRAPAHPAIISVEDFTRAQLRRKARASGGVRGIASLDRSRQPGTRAYLLRGLVRCALCGRRMHGGLVRKKEVYYRCLARTIAPGSPALADHPRTVNLRESDVVEPVNRWIGQLFAPQHRARTVAALVGAQEDPQPHRGAREAARERLSRAQTQLRRLQDAVKAGADTGALVDAINDAQAERVAAQAELDNTPDSKTLSEDEVFTMIDSLGDVGAALTDAAPERLGRLYESLQLGLTYEPHARIVEATIAPRVVSERVGGGT